MLKIIIDIIIIILIFIIIYQLIKCFKRKKIEHLQNNINFLKKENVIDFLKKDNDNYINNFTIYDLKARKVNTKNEYITKITNCIKNFNKNQINIIKEACIKADIFFNNYNDLLKGKEIAKLNWNFALSYYNNYEYEEGMPHTRNNIIFLSDKIIPNEINSNFVNTLIHEKIHIYQRYNPEIIETIINKLNFKKVNYLLDKKIRSHPDLNKNTYIDNNNKKFGCYYKTENPKSIQDVNCLNNNVIYEHQYEYIAYIIANKYNEDTLNKYLHI